jgi:hypothetical protein
VELALPETSWYYEEFLPEVLRQMKAVFLNGNLSVFWKGSVRGMQKGDQWLILLLLFLSASLALFFLRKKEAPEGSKGKKAALGMLCGLFLAVLPAAIFFFIANTWFSFRCMVASLPGVSLFFDSLFSLLRGGWRRAGIVLVCVLTFLSGVSVLSEIDDYKETASFDVSLAAALHEEVGKTPDGFRIGVYNLDPTYLEDQNFYYHEHIHGVSESAWALTGMMTSLYPSSRSFTPFPSETPYFAWNRDASQPENFDLLLFYVPEKNSFIPLTFVREGEKIVLSGPDGEPLLEITEEEGKGYAKILKK